MECILDGGPNSIRDYPQKLKCKLRRGAATERPLRFYRASIENERDLDVTKGVAKQSRPYESRYAALPAR
jgi:hypothetical protein